MVQEPRYDHFILCSFRWWGQGSLCSWAIDKKEGTFDFSIFESLRTQENLFEFLLGNQDMAILSFAAPNIEAKEVSEQENAHISAP